MSRKMNLLVHHIESFSASKFQHMTYVHEVIVKTLLSESKLLFDKHEKLVTTNNTKIDIAINRFKETRTLLLNDNKIYNSTMTNPINTLVSHYDIEVVW